MKIVVSRDNELLQEIDLGEEASRSDGDGALSFFVGRSEDCHVYLDDPKVSREHAELIYKQGQWSIKQCSHFGMLVINGNALNEKELIVGDMLIVGPFVLTFFPAPIEKKQQVISESDEADEEDKETEVAEMMPSDEAATKTVMGEPDKVAEDDSVEDFPDLSEDELDIESSDKNEQNPDENPQENEEEKLADTDFDEVSGFTSAGGESVEFSAENNDTAFPEDHDEDDNEESGTFDSSSAGFDMQADINGDLMDEEGGFDDDESTKVIQSFAKFELDIFGEYAPYDKFRIDQSEILIGRDPEKCHIVLNDPEVSSVHASIKRNNITCTLEDLQSGNGTLLNGERVNKTALTNNDEFIIGSTTFTVKIVSDFLEEESERLMPVEQNQVLEVEEIVEVGEDFDDEDGESPQLEGKENFGEASVPQGKQSLVQKFRSLPPKKQAIYGAVGVMLILLLLDDGSSTKDEQKENQEKNKVAKEESTDEVIEAEIELDPETLELVESSYQLANNYIQKGMYDEALQELDKNVFRYTKKYKNANQLRSIAVAGIEEREKIEAARRRETMEAERRKKVKDFVARAQEAVEEKKVILAEELFGKIATLDPENFELSAMKIELDAWKKQQEREALDKAQKEAERKRMVEELKPGKNLFLRKEWNKAIVRLEQFLEKDGMADDLVHQATNMLEESKKNLSDIVGPLLGRARSLREGQDLKGAYEHYGQVLEHDPSNAEAMNEMNDIREVLRLRSRKVYREAIIAESLSLLKDAKEKYQEVQQISPSDSEYYIKATDKLKEYQ
jgi:pSer/pThr/pTyr-binding forkhead associated (FHA) protein